ncbi:MAG: anthranilate synthase component I family protein, partial [Candidatus Zixiibacteriota bacterium]
SIRWSLDHTAYTQRVNAVKQHIAEGDIYQANLTMRAEANSDASPQQVYRCLRKLNPAPNSAFINIGSLQILSSSPERMLLRDGDFVTTSPIKGTIPVGDTPAQSARRRHELLHSEKDRAELLMIVDLLRNDLGRVARHGTVRVDHLFRVETYSSVLHLVSDISCRLRPEIDLTALCRAVMPGGSITGAPKRRAVEILQQQETVPRGIYTGCIGYVAGERAEFNIAIRTMTHHGGVYHLHAGGGIVADSTADGEQAETLLKARNLTRALGGSW